MTFEEILDQAVAMLQRHGRVTYRTLKRQFDLDDEALEDLKDQLLFSHPVVDEDARGLVWTGEAGTTPEATSAPSAQPEVTQEAQPAQVESPPTESHAPDAERRQLTVMFCDLVDSTTLSGQLDPEDLRDVIRAYQETAAGVIGRYEGHIAQYLGDGLLVYFGWPQAHEDDAQRSIHAGLGIIDAMATLNTQLAQDKGVRLTIRIGIHTGPVVIGEMGGGGRYEQLALGETPNIAARLEGMAQPNTVVLSDTTYRLVEGYFSCDDLGTHTLRGVATPMQAYRVHHATGVQGRLDAAISRGLTPLVGRESEVTLLRERWAQVKEGQGQVILLSGEAGIGKSRLVQVLKEQVAGEDQTPLECRSLPYYQNTAFYPLTDLLQRTLRWHQDDSAEEKLQKLEQTMSQYRLPLEESVPLFAPLLSLPLAEERYAPLPWTPQRQRQKTLESLVAMLLEHSERHPVLFILEDLHWTDPSTLEVLDLLIEQAPTASMMALLTCRPEFEPPWGLRSHLTPIALNRFTRPQVEGMVEQVTGEKRLPADVVQQIVEKTDGVPLYVEELTKSILESGVLHETNGHYELTGPVSSLAIPTTLQDSLMARLDRLDTAKSVAQLGATIGRQFSYELLHLVSSVEEETLQRDLGRLVTVELVYQRGVGSQATYTFKHALIQDAAYQLLLKSTRQQYHQRIAQVLEEQSPETVETQPELVAHHYTEAGLNEQAAGYWQQAGERASERSGHVEAISHLTKGLKLLSTSPQTPERTSRELAMQLTLGPALMATKGYAAPDVQQTYARARELCSHMGDTPQLFPVLMGLCRFYYARGVMQTARELGEQFLALAQHNHDTSWLVVAHTALGTILCFMGEFAEARGHLEQGFTRSLPPQEELTLARRWSTVPRVQCLIWDAYTLLMLGYPDQALHKSREARTLSQEFAHPHSVVYVLFQAARMHIIRREIRAAQELAEAAIRLATEQESTLWAAAGTFIQGFAHAAQGEQKEGMVQMSQSMTAVFATGADVFRPTLLVWFAEAYGQMGQTDEGLRLLTEAQAAVDKNGQRYNESELYRLRGEFLLQQTSPDRAQAESSFHQALNITRQQQAKSLELRAATSLARLWQSQDKRRDAYDLLAPVYGWFTEGFDTADLKDAKALLDELSEGQ